MQEGHDTVDPTPTSKRWNPVNLAYCGTWVGSLVVVAHETYEVLADTFPRDVDPFIHVMTEFALYAPGGALVFSAMAGIRNWIGQANEPRRVQNS